MKRDSIIFYRSFYEAINELPLEMQGKIYSAIFEYSLNFNEVVLEGLPKAIFTLIKPQLDANNKRYENGSKGGRKKQSVTETEPKPNRKETETEPNKNDNVNVNYNSNENILLEKETKDLDFFKSESLDNKIPIPEERKKVAPKKESEPLPEMPEDFQPLWLEWKQYRKARKKKPYAGLKWEQMAVDKLLKLSDKDPITAQKILNQTYENNYEGFFPLKIETNGTKSFSSTGTTTAANYKTTGKISARTVLAQRINAANAGNSESGNQTIDVEAL